jgi:hypothetical protein
VLFSGSYLEIQGVDDFQVADLLLPPSSCAGVVAAVTNIKAHKLALSSVGVRTLDIKYMGVADIEAPFWAYMDVGWATAGLTFALIEYLQRADQWASLRVSANEIYSLDGFIFKCSDRKEAALNRQKKMMRFLGFRLMSTTRFESSLQYLEWLNDVEFAMYFGEVAGEIDKDSVGLQAVALGTRNIHVTKEWLTRAGFDVVREGAGWFSTRWDMDIGLAFFISENCQSTELPNKINNMVFS